MGIFLLETFAKPCILESKILTMKKITIATIGIALILLSCKKEEDTTSTDQNNTNNTPTACDLANDYLPGNNWVGPTIGGTPSDTFNYNTNGNFYRNGNLYGTWYFSNSCDTLIEDETGGSHWEKPLDYVTVDSFAYSNSFGYQFVFHKVN